MFPPGGDPVENFLRTRRPSAPASPRPRTVADDLEGTIFTDPVRDFLVTRDLHRPKPRSVAAIDSLVEHTFQAPKALTDFAHENAKFLEAQPGDSEWGARAKGFVSGVGEAAAGMASPFNVATAVIPGGRIPGAAGALFRAAELGGNAFQTGMAAHQAKDAIEAGDTGEALAAGGMAALGALGSLTHLRGRGGYEAPPPRETFENARDPRFRRGTTGDGLAVPYEPPLPRSQVRVDPIPPPTLGPRAPEALPPGSDPLLRLLEERGTPPADMGPPEPLAGPPVNPQPSPAAPQPSSPIARPGPADATGGLDLITERANLVRQGFPPAMVDDIIGKLERGDTSTPGIGRAVGQSIPPEPLSPIPLDERMAAAAARRQASAPVQPTPVADPLAQVLTGPEAASDVPPTAKFAFNQPDFEGGPDLKIYNIEGGDRHGSSVTADTLRELGIAVPEDIAPAPVAALPAGTLTRLRELGYSEDRLRAMPIEQANAILGQNERRGAGRVESSDQDQLYARMREKIASGERTGSSGAREDFQKKLDLERSRNDAAAERGEAPLPRASAQPPVLEPPATAPISVPERAAASAPPASTAGDPLWPAVRDAARQQGFAGPDEELLAHYNDRKRSALELIDDMQAGADQHSPTALMKEIRKLGGLRPFDIDYVPGAKNRRMKGDLESIVEGFGAKSTRGQKGGASIFRESGLPLDQLIQELHQDPRWRHLDDRGLIEELDTASRSSEDAGYEIPTLEEAMRAAGVDQTRPWWKEGGDDSFNPSELDALNAGDLPDQIRPGSDPLFDILDTGEAQPRLPGDVGAARDRNTRTPEFEAPFSLSRENGRTLQAAERELFGHKEESTAPKGNGWGDIANPSDAELLRLHEGQRDTEALYDAYREQMGIPARQPLTERQMVEAHGISVHDVSRDALADLLKPPVEEVGPTAAGESHPSAPTGDRPAAATVRPNVKDFLTRQLRYSPEEVDAMGPDRAMELGNKVRLHPEGVQAGIAKYAKPKPEAYATEPEARFEGPQVEQDALEKVLGIQRRTRAANAPLVPASEVNVPRGTPPSGSARPSTPAERYAAGEKLTTAERTQLGLPEEVAPKAEPKTQSEVALAKSKMTADARTRAKLLENPTPENVDEYVRLMGEAADRQADREFKGGTGKEDTLRTHERTGEYLASGLGGLEKLYREKPDVFWRMMRMAGGALAGALLDDEDPFAGALAGVGAGAVLSPKLFKLLAAKAPTVAKALRETLPPSIGGKAGKPIGTAGVRGPRDLSKDIGGLEMRVFGQPHRTVPDVWQKISPALDEMAAAERDLPSTTPRMFQFTRNMHLREMLATIDGAAKDAKDAGLHRRSKYLAAMSEELKNTPTVIERIVSDVSGGKISPKAARSAMHRLESAVYLDLLGAALDTAVMNRTQILLAYPHVGAKGLLEGVKASRTTAGKAATRHLELETTSDMPGAGTLARVPNSTVRKVIDAVMSPLKASDVRNRKDAYLAAMYAAKKQGLSSSAANEFAMEVTAQTQGTPGELGSNPFHRHLGPLRMFTKYPAIWGQWVADIASHPDPGVRRRGVGYFLGMAVVGAATGVSVGNILFPRIVPTATAGKAVKDFASHMPGLDRLTGKPDHTLSEDLDPRRGGTALMRYPSKAFHELEHFGHEGFGEHADRRPDGTVKSTHTAMEGFMSLLGLKSERQADEQATLNDAYDWIAEKTRRHNIESRQSKQDLQNAIESGDRAGVAAATKGLSRDQLRSFYKRRQADRYSLLRERVPKADRAEFDRRYRDKLAGGQ